MTKTPKLTGIDLSHWNKVNDFESLKEQGIEFVMLKAGGHERNKYFKDQCFEEYYAKAKAAGLAVGAYYYVGRDHCIRTWDAVLAFAHFVRLLDGKQFEMPVCLDFEEGKTDYESRVAQTDFVKTFCDLMEFAGYYISVYGADIATFKDMLYMDSLTAYDKWVSRLNNIPDYVDTYGIWQYSHTGELEGIDGKVDLDYAYIDYPKVMKEKHLNKF